MRNILKYLTKFMDTQHYLDGTEFYGAFLENNNYIVLNDVCYHSLNDLKFLLMDVLDSFYRERKIKPKYIKREKQNVYLTDFLYNKIDGVMDYTPEVYRIKNDAIELELLLDYIVENNIAHGVIGANYHIAKSLLPDIYHVVDELDISSKRIVQ